MSDVIAPRPSAAARWTGRVLGALPAMFLLLDGGMKLAKPDFIVKATEEVGFPAYAVVPLGVVLVTCVVLYLVPRTSVLGAILLTGYLGGASATHVAIRNGAFEILFPVLFGVLLWSGLYLRNLTLRRLVPFCVAK